MAVNTPPDREVALHQRLEETDRDLVYDLSTLIDRRQVLKLAGLTTISAGLMSIVACAPAASSSALSSASATSRAVLGATASAASGSAVAAADCTVIPEETAGPFPGDGTNGPDVLNQRGIVREDIRPSFRTSTTKATGIPLTIKLTIEGAANNCAPMTGAAVYVWHCDQAGNYSLYSQAAASENYLRGVQATDGSGVVTFQSIFPACYSGRWPHIHFEVYTDLEAATNEANKIATWEAHDLYLHILAEDGIVGFVVFMAILGITLRDLIRVRRRWLKTRPDIAAMATGLMLSIVTYMTTGLFLHLSYARYFWLMLALAGAAAHIGLELADEARHRKAVAARAPAAAPGFGARPALRGTGQRA